MEFRLASAGPLFASSEQIDELAQHADAAEGGDEDALARAPLEDERLVAVDPLALAAADLDGRELVEPNPEPLRRAPAVQNKLVLAELEPAAGDRVLTGAPDDGLVGRALAGEDELDDPAARLEGEAHPSGRVRSVCHSGPP